VLSSKVLFLCPHCSRQDHALFREPADGGESRSMTLQEDCFNCDEPLTVTVEVTVVKDKA
jgi:hypothetical protein